MVDKIKINIFGSRRNPPIGACSCGACCDNEKSTGILYNDLVYFLDSSDIKDYVDIKFVDLITEVVDGHNTMKYFIQKGFGIPITTINGEIKLCGGISNNIIYQEIKRLLCCEWPSHTLHKTV